MIRDCRKTIGEHQFGFSSINLSLTLVDIRSQSGFFLLKTDDKTMTLLLFLDLVHVTSHWECFHLPRA